MTQDTLLTSVVTNTQRDYYINNLLNAIDDFGANTLALVNQGPQGYSAFISARDTLREMVLNMPR